MKSMMFKLVVAGSLPAVFVSGAFNPCSYDDAVSYYQDLTQDIASLSKADLRVRLNARISLPYRILQYTDNTTPENDVWWALSEIDKDPDDGDLVKLIYRQTSVQKAPSSAGSRIWNREHTWPQSRFSGTKDPDAATAEIISTAKTDIHAIRPSDPNVNSARGNKPYQTCVNDCRAGHTTAPLTSTSTNGGFEAPDNVKGDLARGIFYMYTKYPSLALDLVEAPGATPTTQMGSLSDLLSWHLSDPVSSEERWRNDGVCGIQLNRNPFVDFPCLAEQLFGDGSKSCTAEQLRLVDDPPPQTSAPTTSPPTAATSPPTPLIQPTAPPSPVATQPPSDIDGSAGTPSSAPASSPAEAAMDSSVFVVVGSLLGLMAFVVGGFLLRFRYEHLFTEDENQGSVFSSNRRMVRPADMSSRVSREKPALSI